MEYQKVDFVYELALLNDAISRPQQFLSQYNLPLESVVSSLEVADRAAAEPLSSEAS